jgi:ATP-binding cassette subfamily B protein
MDPAERMLPSLNGESSMQEVTRGDSWTIARESFGYVSNVRTLTSIDMELPPGAYCAVVGSSGSGKSSLVGLLMRFHEPQGGSIRTGGRDVQEIPLDRYRDKIGYVPQEIVLFDSSLKDNIRMGNLDASDEEVERTARAAAIHNWIVSLPEGYDTAAGERGNLLSGGERQRIALARALVRQPYMLLLDEVTSMLDPGTEQEVNDTLIRLRGTSTVVSVTHRLQTVVHAGAGALMNNC